MIQVKPTRCYHYVTAGTFKSNQETLAHKWKEVEFHPASFQLVAGNFGLGSHLNSSISSCLCCEGNFGGKYGGTGSSRKNPGGPQEHRPSSEDSRVVPGSKS